MTDSDGYVDLRGRLLDAEVALMQQREAVAELRRELPPQPLDAGYDLAVARERGDEARAGQGIALDELVSEERPLLLYHLMYGKAQTEACPMCAMWIDGWDALAGAIRERADLAVVAAAPAEEVAALAAQRGWDALDFYSAASSSIKADYGSEDDEGHQTPVMTIFDREAGGPVRHRYTGGAHLEGEHWRGIALLRRVCHPHHHPPEGRGDCMPSLG
jgi:predicted dithiol-disulfide oxidoreductase (DUF899 family)